MPLSNDMAALIGFACETLFYGAYCIIFILSVVFLIFRRRTPRINVAMLVATMLLFACCTTHFAIEFNHFYTTLFATGKVAGFATETLPLQGADAMISICDFVGDMILLYRCWLVWGRNYWVVLLPFLTSLGGLACIFGVLALLQTLDPTSATAPVALIPLGDAGYILPLVTNLLITSLIVYRIWSTSREARALSGILASSPSTQQLPGLGGNHNRISATLTQGTAVSPNSRTRFLSMPSSFSAPFSLTNLANLRQGRSHESLGASAKSIATGRSKKKRSRTEEQIYQAMIIVVESGLLYLVVQLVFVILFALGHPAQAIAAVIACQVYGIAPTLIVFRVALGLAPSQSMATAVESGGMPEWAAHGRGGPGTVTNDSRRYPTMGTVDDPTASVVTGPEIHFRRPPNPSPAAAQFDQAMGNLNSGVNVRPPSLRYTAPSVISEGSILKEEDYFELAEMKDSDMTGPSQYQVGKTEEDAFGRV